MLSHIPVTWRMVLSALLPALALLYFSTSLVIEQRKLSAEMGRLEETAQFNRNLSELIHELQRERGRSAGFVGSQGASAYRQPMMDQRAATDRARSTYQAARQEIASMAARDDRLDELLHHVDELLEGLSAHRAEIDTLTLNLGQTVGPYTGSITVMLETVAQMARMGGSSVLTSKMIGLLNIMSAKENAGIERAIGSNIYASRSISPDRHQRAITLHAGQQAFFLEFRELMGPQWGARLDETLSLPASVAVDTARQNIIDAGYGAPLADMTGVEWFELTTARIELLMDLEEALAGSIISDAQTLRSEASSAANFALLLTVTIIVITFIVEILLVGSVVRPLSSITDGLRRLAEGETDVDIQGEHRRDEIGVLARTAQSFRKATQERETAIQERARAEQRAMHERRRVLTEMASNVEAATLESVGSVAETAQTLASSSETIRTTLENAGKTADQVTQATEQNVKHTGRAADLASELSSAIREVTQQITRGDQLARNAIDEADRSRQSVQELNEAAQQISDFISLITDIAEQTNLLALNATIEAARAGDAGKGFAVVASEVKELAAQTNQSTTQIAERVAQIQSRTQSTVDAMNAITQSIETIGEVTASVAAAMEEQSASTGSLSSFVDQNREALTRVSTDILELVEMTTRSSREAQDMAQLVQTMSARANDANSAIPKIVQEAVRAAENRKEERSLTRHNAEITVDGRQQKVTLVDASTHGMRIVCKGLKEGQLVKISSPVLNETATVVWVRGEEAGMSFKDEISANSLQALIDAGASLKAA